jgi:hypothetical protein
MPLANNKRTGGPKTTQGRQLTAGNAVKSGAYATQVVLPGEDADQFEQLKRQLVEDFEPVGLAEAAMVHDLAVLSWKKLRIDRVENSVMAQLILLPLTEDSIQKSFGTDFLSAAMPWLVPYRPVTQQTFDSVTTLLAQVQSLLNTPLDKREHAKLRKRMPAIYMHIDEWAIDYKLNLGASLDDVHRASHEKTLDQLLESLSRSYQPICWLWENRERVHTAICRAQDSRLLGYMKIENTQRAQEDTSRAFFRTLAELRKQQDWRVRRTAITVEDVTPTPSSPVSVGNE